MIKELFNKDDNRFPEQLKEIRKSLKLNTFTFSNNCNLSQSTIIRLENKLLFDHKRPCKQTWDKINNYLKELKYFDYDGEDKSFLLLEEEKKRIIYKGPLKTMWQPINKVSLA